MTRNGKATDGKRPLPPHSIEAEMALLGSLIVAGTENHQHATEAMKLIRDKQDFYLPRHQAVYQAVRECYAKHGRMDSVLLTERLRESGSFESLRRGAQSPADFLVSLAESVPVGTNAPYYARIVAERAQARRLIAWAEGIQRRAEQLEESPMAIAREAMRALEKAVGKKVNGHRRDATHGARPAGNSPVGREASSGSGAMSRTDNPRKP